MVLLLFYLRLRFNHLIKEIFFKITTNGLKIYNECFKVSKVNPFRLLDYIIPLLYTLNLINYQIGYRSIN